MDDPITLPVQVALTPDTVQVAHMLRVFARHLANAADEIEHMVTPTGPHDTPGDAR